MKISAIKFAPFNLPLVSPLRTSTGLIKERKGWIIWVSDNEGGLGVGEATPLEGFGMESHRETGRVLEEWSKSLPGQVLGDLSFQQGLPPAVFGLVDTSTVAPAARHGLELALLDLTSQKAGVPLARFLNPSAAREVSVNAVLGEGTPEKTAEEALKYIDQGFQTLKIKVGSLGEEEELERLRLVRRKVGSDIKIRIDANGSWKAAQAQVLLERMAELDIEYAEQPLEPGDIKGMALLTRTSPIPIAADESLQSLTDARLILDKKAANLLILKPMALGGILTALQVARLAAKKNIPVVFTTTIDGTFARMGAAHAAAALPESIPNSSSNFSHGLATEMLFPTDLVTAPPRPKGGKLKIPQEPGLGQFRESLRPEFMKNGPS